MTVSSWNQHSTSHLREYLSWNQHKHFPSRGNASEVAFIYIITMSEPEKAKESTIQLAKKWGGKSTHFDPDQVNLTLQ